jgi:Rv2525c-like, glycoside hydrolase-like domain/CARDB
MHGKPVRVLPLTLLALGTSLAMLAQGGEEAGGAILQMQRLDRDRGFVLTDSALLATRDGGASWTDASPDRGLAGVTGVFFLDADRGWLAGTTPGVPSRLVVLDTADGGGSWRERPADASDTPGAQPYAEAQVHFADSDHGWLLGRLATGSAVSLGTLLRTADGGETWELLPAPPAAGRVVFASAERGFMTGAPASERLYRTFDGGRSWQELSLPVAAAPGQALYALPRFTTPQDGTLAVTVASRRPRLLTFVTRDGGLTWQPARSLALPAGDYSDPVPAALTPSGDPAALGAGASVVLAPSGAARGLRMRIRPNAGPSLQGAVPTRAFPSVRALAADEDGTGWALVAEGQCEQGVCRQTTRVVALDASGGATDVLTRTTAGPLSGGPEGPATSAATISFHKGFDKCTAGSVAQMQTWKASSPYRDANIYHGGSARACSQTNLTASWVAAVFQQGWRLIPTWVGPQAPCSSFGKKFSLTPSTARAQGLAEADAAVNAAAALGLGAGTPVYYDMEYYATTTACSAAVRAFVDGWSGRVKARGYVSGVYGTASNAQTDWRPGLFTSTPDAVWVASWNCTGSTCSYNPTSVLGIRGLSDSYWTNNQRIHQYWGGHNETWGGVTFNVDANYANGPVASPDVAGQPDLVVDSLSISPGSPVAGQAVTFSAVVRNAGTAATPAGVTIGVGYVVDGTQVSWGSVAVSLAAGATVTVGTGGGSWTATAGTHTLAAVADDVNRIAESNEANNQLSRSVTVGSGVAQFTCDDGDACFALAGPSAYWHRATTCGGTALGYGGDMYWTYVNGSVVSNSVKWTPALGGAGTYAVSVFISRCNATSQTAKYKVVHGGVTEYRTVNQNVYYDAWVSLGTFSFTGAGGEYVELTDATGESYTTKRLLGFDAVKWVRQ